ncbi:hypothetical protein PM082_020375 [Marasmius tenuissimus]|nr:hypothetical protein PM082_020375 [Marasmius tenuissimus]
MDLKLTIVVEVVGSAQQLWASQGPTSQLRCSLVARAFNCGAIHFEGLSTVSIKFNFAPSKTPQRRGFTPLLREYPGRRSTAFSDSSGRLCSNLHQVFSARLHRLPRRYLSVTHHPQTSPFL